MYSKNICQHIVQNCLARIHSLVWCAWDEIHTSWSAQVRCSPSVSSCWNSVFKHKNITHASLHTTLYWTECHPLRSYQVWFHLFRSSGTVYGSRGWNRCEDLEALLCCIRLLAWVCVRHCSRDRHHQPQTVTKSSLVLWAMLGSLLMAEYICASVKYLQKISMIGFIVLQAAKM